MPAIAIMAQVAGDDVCCGPGEPTRRGTIEPSVADSLTLVSVKQGGGWNVPATRVSLMQTRRISSVKVGVRHRKDLGDLDKLAESLETIGLLHPVVIDTQNRLIAGQRRLEAAKLLAWKTVAVTVVDLEAVTLGEFAENACRKDFTPSEIAAIAKVVRPLEQEKAHRRRLNGLRNQKIEVAHDEGKTRDIVARFTGISGRTLDKITAIVDAAEEDPAVFGHLKDEMDAEPRSANRCYQRLKAIRQQQIAQEEKIEPVDVGSFKLKENEIICGGKRLKARMKK
jgi:ParB/RepB/Spo0J family partition protein